MIRKLLTWLNAKLNIVETDPDMNAYYAWADTRLDERAAEDRRLLADLTARDTVKAKRSISLAIQPKRRKKGKR